MDFTWRFGVNLPGSVSEKCLTLRRVLESDTHTQVSLIRHMATGPGDAERFEI